MVFGKLFAVLIIANIVIKKIFKSYTLSLLLPLFLIFNNFTLESLYYGSISFISLGYISTLLVIYISYLIYENGLSLEKIIWLSISCLISFHPFVFIALNIFELIFFIFLFFKCPLRRIKIMKYYFMYLVISILLNLFWLLPFLFSTLSISNATIHGEVNNNAVFDAYRKISTVTNNLSFVSFFGDIGKSLYFSIWQYFFYFLLNVIIILSLIKKKVSSYFIFLYVCLVIFLDLSLGPNGLFFGKLFSYLWQHFSFFSFFRSFKRFYILVPILYLLIVSNVFNNLKKFKNTFLILFSIITVFIHYPLLSGDLLGSVRTFNIPNPYVVFNQKISSDPDLYNIMDLPYNRYEWYTWTETNNKVLHSPDLNWINYYFSKPDLTLRAATYLINYSGLLQNIDTNIYSGNSINEDIETLNVKYILIHKDLVDQDRKLIDYKLYEDYFKENGYLITENNDYFEIFLNPNYVSGTKISVGDISEKNNFTYINPSKYQLEIPTKKSDQIKIDFKENFSNNWGIYYSDNKSTLNSNPFFDIKYLFEKDLGADTHVYYNNFGNSWTITQAGSLNSGGNFVLFFKTQAYFLLGLLITIVTIFCLGIIGIYGYYCESKRLRSRL